MEEGERWTEGELLPDVTLPWLLTSSRPTCEYDDDDGNVTGAEEVNNDLPQVLDV